MSANASDTVSENSYGCKITTKMANFRQYDESKDFNPLKLHCSELTEDVYDKLQTFTIIKL